jgi:predicted acylesterase/phospholipase RssA
MRPRGTQHRSGRRTKRKAGIALAGGGPLGGIYEIGALAALAEAIDGVNFNDLDVYVGVSAGSFVAAGLANGLRPAEMVRMFIESETAEEPFEPALLLKPALGEFARRSAMIPSLLLNAARRYIEDPSGRGVFDAIQRLSRALPTGIFNGAEIEKFLARMFAANGRTDDFRKLAGKLYLVATDLDSGRAVAFGSKGLDAVPISTAIRASSALPGLFSPVEIGGRHYVDGALQKTLHASIALKEGAELVFCINPLVPYDDTRLARKRSLPPLVSGGLPIVMGQMFRAMIHSRLQTGLRKYETEFAGADVLLLEPQPGDAYIFYSSIFSYANRRKLCEHAYQRTRADLLARRDVLSPLLARHGARLDLAVLQDKSLRLVRPDFRRRATSAPQKTLARLADTLHDLERYLRLERTRAA